MNCDVIITGGTVVDGTGATPRRADVAVTDGAVTAITPPGELADARSRTVITADGRAIAPGFIDAHAHSDLAMFLPEQWRDITLAPLRQGVTTEVCGNCGESPFPRTPVHADEVDAFTRAGFQVGTDGFDSLDSYAAFASTAEMPTNQAPLLGHGMLRGAAMGFADRDPDESELATMKRLATEAFEQGAFGLSAGLMYTPGQFAKTPEIAAIAEVATRFDAPYVSHMRDETDLVDVSIREALEIGRRSGAGVHISHHKVAGRPNWGRSSQTLAMLDEARAAGDDVTIDMYPYTAGSTSLHALLPPWVNSGGLDAMLTRLGDVSIRERVGRDYMTGLPGWQNLAGASGWDNVVIAGSPSDPRIEGLSIAQIAADTGRSVVDVVCHTIRADSAYTAVILHMMAEGDVTAIQGWDAAMLGSDGVPLPGKPHPRIAGTFTRALRAPVGGDPWQAVADRVRRMTSMPADRYRIPGGRGRLAVGSAADIVIFDPANVTDRSTYVDPLLPPAGIDHVLVGGVVSLTAGALTGHYAGQVLRAR